MARAEELGCGLGEGAVVVIARARPHAPEEGDWRARVLTLAERGARVIERSTLAGLVPIGPLRAGNADDRDLLLLVPAPDEDTAARAGTSVLDEMRAGLEAFALTVARSRRTADPADLHRATSEAILAANVAEARGIESLNFEETGAYRLLLPAMNEDPRELQRFHEETVAPLAAYDDQYETELVKTLETFLDADGNVAGTAEKPVHPPPHGPLPAGSGARAERSGRGLHRWPRASVAGPEGHAGAGNRTARRPGPRARRRGRPGPAGEEGPLARQLGSLDSNQILEDQNLLCCQLHHSPIGAPEDRP